MIIRFPTPKHQKIRLPFWELQAFNREVKIHVYGNRQTADLSWESLRIENKQIKTVQNNSYG